MESHFISLRGAGRLARCTLAGLLLILSAPAQAGCENSREILPGTLIDFDPPEAVFAGANGAGRRKYVVMQRLWVSTELDDRYDLPGRTTDRERAMMVAVCDRDLPLATVPTDGDIVACENAPDPTRNAPTTEGWRGAYYSPGGALWNGTTYAVPSPAPTVWIKGNYRAAEDIWWRGDLPSPKYRTHTFWPTFRVQASEPGCGTRLRVHDYEDTERLLDNRGFGLQSWDGDLGDLIHTGTSGDGDPATSQTGIGAGFFGAAANVGTIDPRDTVPLSGLTTPPPLPTAYGRVEWDFLWHGTCTVGGQPKWCLPNSHRRHALDLTLDDGVLVQASACDNATCNYACPTENGAGNEAHYDFHVIERFVDAADRVSTGAADQWLGPRQAAALRIMSMNPQNGEADSDRLPRFLDGCLAAGEKQGGPNGTFFTGSWDTASLQDQVDLLVRAFADGDVSPTDTTDNVATQIPGFAGYAHDPRVTSIDVGIVGSYGEWNVDGADLTTNHLDFASSATYQPWSALTCLTSAGAEPWFERIFDNVESGFDGLGWITGAGAYRDGQPVLIGKMRYSAFLTSTLQQDCWNDYGSSVTRAMTPAKSAGVIHDAGLRHDSWGNHGLADHNANAGINLSFFRERLDEAGDNWKRSAYQFEIAWDLPQLVGGNKVSGWNYHDWDATVRLAMNEHFSAFNFKNVSWPTSPANWCNCADFDPDPAVQDSGRCLERQVERLLRFTGPRISLQSVSLPTLVDKSAADDLVVKLRWENDGNAPFYQYGSLRMRLWNPATHAWQGPGGTTALHATDARTVTPRTQPCHPSLALRTGTGVNGTICADKAAVSMSTDDQSWSCTATEVSGAPVETVVHTWSINTPANFVPNVAATTAFDLYVWIQDETDPDYPPFDLAITETLALREGAGADPDAARIYYAGSLEVQP